MAQCEPFLFRQIDSIKPKVIVALGKFAAQCLLATDRADHAAPRPRVQYRGAMLIPTFHPAYLLRNPSAKRDVWEDMKKVRASCKRLNPSQTQSACSRRGQSAGAR